MKNKASAVIIITLILILAIPVMNAIALTHTVSQLPEQTGYTEYEAEDVTDTAYLTDTLCCEQEVSDLITKCYDAFFNELCNLFDILKNLLG